MISIPFPTVLFTILLFQKSGRRIEIPACVFRLALHVSGLNLKQAVEERIQIDLASDELVDQVVVKGTISLCRFRDTNQAGHCLLDGTLDDKASELFVERIAQRDTLDHGRTLHVVAVLRGQRRPLRQCP